MESTIPTVYVVDDDPRLCALLEHIFQRERLPVKTFLSAESFLEIKPEYCRGCMVLDVKMQGMSGLQLQAELLDQQITMPVIIMSAYAEVPMAVAAMRQRAFDFLEKPLDEARLVQRVREALAMEARVVTQREARLNAASRLPRLTPRENEVLDLVVEGLASKQIAYKLGLSEKTVEIHRGSIMRKMEAGNVAELVRLVMTARSHEAA